MEKKIRKFGNCYAKPVFDIIGFVYFFGGTVLKTMECLVYLD